jgi:hypothetical protein
MLKRTNLDLRRPWQLLDFILWHLGRKYEIKWIKLKFVLRKWFVSQKEF